jgi:hypothetical protein
VGTCAVELVVRDDIIAKIIRKKLNDHLESDHDSG